MLIHLIFQRQAKLIGACGQIMDAISQAYEGEVRIIDGSSMHVQYAVAALKKVIQIVVLGEATEVIRKKIPCSDRWRRPASDTGDHALSVPWHFSRSRTALRHPRLHET